MESKCPVCQKGYMIPNNYAEFKISCNAKSCQFRCQVKDLIPITAAMDLARLTVQMKTCRAYCPERAFLYAQDRVVIVFGGSTKNG
jgi:hypothetical protein